MALKSEKLSYSDLYPYQRLMIDHIRSHDSSALWVDMGLGKTVSTLTAIKEAMADFDTRRTLVVAPLRVARKVWTDEIQKWDHLAGLTTSRIIGSRKQRLAGLHQEADIHMINRENLEWLSMLFMEHRNKRWYWTRKWPWDTVILDESSSFKNQDTNRYRAMRRVNKKVTTLVQLTGTPAPNGLGDLFAQSFLMDGGERLGKDKKMFHRRWWDPPDAYSFKHTLKPYAEAEIHSRMKDLALTLRAEDYLDLEPVTFNNIRVDLTAKQRKDYEYFKRKAVLEIAGQRITAVNAGVLWGKLLQLANGAVYTQHPAWETFHEEKVEALMELHEHVPGSMIVAYTHRSDLARIAERFNRDKVNWRQLQTEKDENDWNAGKIDRLVLHPASAGHGLNLHPSGAEEIVWFGLTANFEWYDQANARLTGGHRRVGRHVTVHHIVCDDTIDEDVLYSLNDKERTGDRLKEATKRLIREAA